MFPVQASLGSRARTHLQWEKRFGDWLLEIVERDDRGGFEVIPRRWAVQVTAVEVPGWRVSVPWVGSGG